MTESHNVWGLIWSLCQEQVGQAADFHVWSLVRGQVDGNARIRVLRMIWDDPTVQSIGRARAAIEAWIKDNQNKGSG